MIHKDVFAKYAQLNEDIILAALLHNVKKGFYVDIGANHEEYHSVTKYFYEKGWKGINIEPIPRLAAEIKKNRARDITINCAISEKQGRLTFREYPQHDGFSTLSQESMNELSALNIPHKDYVVEANTLSKILEENKVSQIDFMKIDVEGYEGSVIASNNWKKYRPKVICVEANHKHDNWSNTLISNKYKKVIFDGLNEYYLANDSMDLFEGFAERAALLNHNALQKELLVSWNKDLETITILEKKLNDSMKQIDQLIEQLNNYKTLSLKNIPFSRRLKRAVYGLTIDWFRYKF